MAIAGTPAALGVYTDHGGPPDLVSRRPWRGIEVQMDGTPGRTGNAILARVRGLEGHLGRFVRGYVVGLPSAWRSFVDLVPATGAGQTVGSRSWQGVCYCYVIDQWARRMDIFATHAGANGVRVASIWFDARGDASGGPLMIPRGTRLASAHAVAVA